MRVLGMFARRPEPGRTKTRLAATIGDDITAEVYSAFLQDLLQRCPGIADRFVAAATPDERATAEWFRANLMDGSELVYQPTGDLGQKIDWFFNTATSGDDRAVLIGSDSPDLPTSIIESAFERLEHADLVLSPASDGGFVLIGLRRRHPELFQRIRWSSSETLADTLQSAARCGLSSELLSPWYDVDVVQDLVDLKANLESPESQSAACPATLSVLQHHWPRIQAAVRNA